MNKSAVVITGAGANSIIRAAKTMLSSHYSHEPLHVKICVQTGAPLHLIYSESRGFKQGGKRVIMVKIASKLVGRGGTFRYHGGSKTSLGLAGLLRSLPGLWVITATEDVLRTPNMCRGGAINYGAGAASQSAVADNAL